MLLQNILLSNDFLLHVLAVLGYLLKLKRSLGLVFGARFQHTFSIKMLYQLTKLQY